MWKPQRHDTTRPDSPPLVAVAEMMRANNTAPLGRCATRRRTTPRNNTTDGYLQIDLRRHEPYEAEPEAAEPERQVRHREALLGALERGLREERGVRVHLRCTHARTHTHTTENTRRRMCVVV
jgi:hypothetical protein